MTKETTEAQKEASRINGELGGRPPYDENNLRYKKMTIGVSEEELDVIRLSAKSANLSLSEFGRRRIMGYTIKSKIDEQMIRELNRMGGLLKHTHNETSGVFATQTAEILRQIRELITAITKDIKQ